MTRDQKTEMMKLLRATKAEDLGCIAVAHLRTDNETAVIVSGNETAAALVASTIYTSLTPQPGAIIH